MIPQISIKKESKFIVDNLGMEKDMKNFFFRSSWKDSFHKFTVKTQTLQMIFISTVYFVKLSTDDNVKLCKSTAAVRKIIFKIFFLISELKKISSNEGKKLLDILVNKNTTFLKFLASHNMCHTKLLEKICDKIA